MRMKMEIRFLTRSKAAKVGDTFTANDGRLFTRAPEHDKESGKCVAYIGDSPSYYVASFDEVIAGWKQEVERKEKVARLIENTSRRLLKMGFELDHVSESGSRYFVGQFGKDLIRVRVSDHHVPMTEAREWNLNNGGHSCSDRQIVVEL